MSTFHLLSDIHLELGGANSLPKGDADHLFLAGDIGNPFDDNYSDFLVQCSQKYKKVFLITGNHEYYQGKIELLVDQYIRYICKKLKLDNIHFLQKDEYHLDDNIVILGCTLWSNIKYNAHEIQYSLNDFRRIKFMKSVSDYNLKHFDHLNWLENKIIEHKRKIIIIITHHLPSMKLVADKYKENIMNDAFANRLDQLIIDNSQISYWLCGHSHTANQVVIGSTQVVLNPSGYTDEDSEWDPNQVYTL